MSKVASTAGPILPDALKYSVVKQTRVRAVQDKPHTCPYLDLADVRCSGRLTLKSLAEAYRLCFGNPAACPVHQLLASEGACNAAEQQEVTAA
jgi:hypothetical protein